MDNQLLGALGLIASARKLIYGELLFTKIKEKKIKIVIICSDMSDKQKSNLINKCSNNDVTHVLLDSINSEMLSKSIGKFNVKAVGIEDNNFTKLVKSKIKI